MIFNMPPQLNPTYMPCYAQDLVYDNDFSMIIRYQQIKEDVIRQLKRTFISTYEELKKCS